MRCEECEEWGGWEEWGGCVVERGLMGACDGAPVWGAVVWWRDVERAVGGGSTAMD